MTWVADTSWLYALIDDADPHHQRAREEASQPDPVEVPEVVLAETIDLIRYRHGKRIAKAALDAFERLPHFVIGVASSHQETGQVWRAHAALSYVDAAAIAAARRSHSELRSFDRRQVRAMAGLR